SQATVVWRWNSRRVAPGESSLLAYCEDNGRRLRSRFLRWIHDLGEHSVKGVSLIDLLVVEEGLSYWWLSSFTEESVYKMPIGLALQAIALDEVVRENDPERLVYVGDDRATECVVRQLAAARAIAYEWRRAGRRRTVTLRDILVHLPRVRALASLAI